jgi:dolichol-phosphate mannosyltransferase
VIGGVQMIMLGVLGEYLWRALDESRRRPRFLVEATTAGMARARNALAGSVREER